MNRKILRVCVVVLLLNILLCSCQNHKVPAASKDTGEPKGTVVVTATVTLPPTNPDAVPSQPKKAVLLPEHLRKQIQSKDKSLVLLNADFSYPQIENLSGLKTIDSINNGIKENAQKEFDKSVEEGRKAALEFFDYHKVQGRPTSLLPFVTEQTYENKYNDNYIISNLVTSFSYFGGAHPSTLYSSYTYHLLTGKKLPATYFLTEKISEKDEKQYVAKVFYEAYKKAPDNYYPDAEQILKEGKFDYGYYLTEDSVVFYMNPYVIAPYVAGLQEISVERKK
jgi:hypothetical protein